LIVDGISMAGWFYPASVAAANTLACLGISGSANSFARLHAHTTSALRLAVRNDAGTDTSVDTSTTFGLNAWHHAGGYLSLARRTVLLDGAGKATDASAITGMSAFNLLQFARNTGAATLMLTGRLAFWAFWYGELADAEFADLAAGAHPLDVKREALIDEYQLLGTVSPEPNRLKYWRTLSLVAAPAQGASDPTVDAGPTVPQWSTPVQLFDTDVRFADGLSGRLYSVGRDTGVITSRYSDNQGATWSTKVTIVASGETLPIYNPLVALGSRVHVLSQLTSNGSLRVRTSTDGGDTWGAPVTLASYAFADARARVELATRGVYVHVQVGRTGGPSDADNKIYYWRSTDSGVTFGALQELDNDTVNRPLSGGIVAEEDRVWIAYAKEVISGTLKQQPYLIYSTDNGATWSSPAAVDGSSLNPQARPRPIANGPYVYVIWEEPLDHDQGTAPPNATRAEIRIARSTNYGLTFEPSVDLTHRPQEYLSHPAAAQLSPTGLLHTIYRHQVDAATLGTDDAIGYRLSADRGVTWWLHETAMYVAATETHPLNLVETADYVHAASAGGWYARREIIESVTTAPIFFRRRRAA
jgi:hypothetical protein